MGFVKSDAPGEKDSGATTAPHAPPAGFCIAHLSDLHLFNPRNMSFQDFFSKRVLGYLSWRLGRKREHRVDFLPALRNSLAAAAVDHVAITGDLTHLGHGADFKSAARILQQLAAPDRLTLVPGNHDAYVEDPWREKLVGLRAYLSSDEGPGEQALTGPDGALLPGRPSLRKRGPIALIGVSSACPSPPFMATGTIGRRQLDRLETILNRTAEEAFFRLILIHHPPVPGQVGHRKRLTDRAAFAKVIGRTGAELILHGHTHRFEQAGLEGPRGKIPVLGTPSLTALSGGENRRAGFRLFRIQTAASRWQVEMVVYRYSPSQAEFIPADSRLLSIPSRD